MKLHFQHEALLGAFEKKVKERVDSLTEALASGRAVDYADYKSKVAAISAFHLVLDDLRAVVKTYLDEDQDDD